MNSQIVLNILFTFSVYLLIAQSFSLIYSVTKFFFLTHAYIITGAAYFVYFFFNQLKYPFYLSIILAVIISIGISLLFEYFFYRPLRKKNASSLVLLITSLGLYIICQNISSLIWGDDFLKIQSNTIQQSNEIFGAYITDIQIVSIVLCFSLFFIVNLFLKNFKLGKEIRAVSSRFELSYIFGINSDKITYWVFGIGSGLAAISGILLSLDTGIIPSFGFNILLYGIVVIIIGGIGSPRGLFFGAFILSVTQHLSVYYFDSKWVDAITFLILILFLLIRPLGLSGKKIKKIEI
jgi:branched-chain amino acid transport system permease protein